MYQWCLICFFGCSSIFSVDATIKVEEDVDAPDDDDDDDGGDDDGKDDGED